MKREFEIVFEDEHLLLVNKGPFVLTIPDRFAPDKLNLYNWLCHHYDKVFTVHRLDKETSGILVFAKSEEAHRHLSLQFEQRTTEKYYYVLVEGVLHLDEGVIDKPIAQHPHLKDRMIVADSGKPSVTLFKVKERFNNYTFVEANIKTGRTHQIRVHFQALGYPLAVDSIYGRKSEFYLSQVKRNKFRMGKNQEERPLMSRSSLHAGRLSFLHPATNIPVAFEAELTRDFEAVMKQLRKWGQ